MPLADLTSAQAVEQAIDEFDRLGRDAFLHRYGFGRSRGYFLERNRSLYDSKAIVGAAHGFQFPALGAMTSGEFSGGDATVRVKLESLGFKVVVRDESGASAVEDSRTLEKDFHRRMIDIYVAAKSEARYNASRFLAMVNEHGGLETARILLHATAVSEGYTALWERQRLDLTVEAVILEGRWHSLFTPADRRIAIQRLKNYGYAGPLPDSESA